MAATRTLAQLRTTVRQKGNYNRSAVFTDTILTEWINTAIKSVYNLLLANFGDHYYTTETELSTAVDSDSVALPSDFLKLVALDLKHATNDYTPIPRYTMRDRSRYEDATWNTTRPFQYAYTLMAGNIKLARTASAVDTLRLTYVPTFTDLSADSDTFDGVNGYEELVVQKVWYDCAAREKDPAMNDIRARVAELTREIEVRSKDRDVGSPMPLVDHTLEGYY